MWEVIETPEKPAKMTIVSHRLRVPGGWIVRTIAGFPYTGGSALDVVQTFVPDSLHLWNLEQER